MQPFVFILTFSKRSALASTALLRL